MRNSVLNTIAVIIMVLGGLLLIGTAGSLELDHVTMVQAIWQAFIGVGLVVLGGRLFKTTYERETYTYYNEEDDYE